MTKPAERRFGGYFFERTLGEPVEHFASLLDVERAVARRRGCELPLRPYDAGLLVEQGNVFPVTTIQEDLGQAIDRELARMRGRRG